MPRRLRSWLQETHGPGFELLRHFVVRFFDSEVTSLPGEWQKVAAGILAAVLTALQWQSLFPSLRDCLALAALPVKPRQIFLAKSGALLLVFAAFVLSL